MSRAVKTFTVTLPKPHAAQAKVLASDAKRIVICAGRRGGKTTVAARVAIKKAFAGRRVLLASTTQDQADSFWEKCKTWLSEVIEAKHIIKNEQRRIIEFPEGGRIKVKTASDADTLRGDHADFLVLDECALLAPDAWDTVGAPMLLDNDGDAWFISSPRRRNWFFGLYQKALGDTSGRWAAFHFTSLDNPHLSQAALEEIIGDQTEEAYKQEILAEFLEGEGAVFRNISGNLTTDVTTPEAHVGHKLVMGVDWAKARDYTVLCVFCATCMREVDLDRFNKVDWSLQRGRLTRMRDKWGVGEILAEENSIGGPNIEALQKDGLPVRSFTTTAQSKPPLIQSLVLAFERSEAKWLDIPVATGELAAYELRLNPQTGRPSYSAPVGIHDDTVIARALAWNATIASRLWQIAG